MIERFLWLVAAIRPAGFLMENVPGIIELDRGAHFSRLLRHVYDAGYRTSLPTIIEGGNFGVPQRRRRCFILGVLGRATPRLPSCSLEIPHMTPITGTTVAHALLDIPTAAANHVPREHAPGSIARYRRLHFGEREKLGRVDRLDPKIPSKTVIAGGSNGGGRSHLHPYIARTLTVRECARLQTFPDDYVFEGSIARQFTQVGNAVPPFLAAQLGYFMRTEIFGDPSDPPEPPWYLARSESVARLCSRLRRQSLRQKRTWIYLDSLTRDPASSSLDLFSSLTMTGAQGSCLSSS